MAADWVMCLLTLVYVIATIAILFSNRKSANAAMQQLEYAQETQRQNASLQLLDKRAEIFNLLSEWMTYSGILTIKAENTEQYSSRLERFYDITNRKTIYVPLTVRDHEHPEIACLLSRLESESKTILLADLFFTQINYGELKEFVSAFLDVILYIDLEMNAKSGPYLHLPRLQKATTQLHESRILETMRKEMQIA